MTRVNIAKIFHTKDPLHQTRRKWRPVHAQHFSAQLSAPADEEPTGTGGTESTLTLPGGSSSPVRQSHAVWVCPEAVK